MVTWLLASRTELCSSRSTIIIQPQLYLNTKRCRWSDVITPKGSSICTVPPNCIHINSRSVQDPPITDGKYTFTQTNYHPLLRNNFKYFLTLFSKFFSSFPHGTCSLSVSRIYLALDGIYHPLRAALPSNPTLKKRPVRKVNAMTDGILTLYDVLFQRTYTALLSEHAFIDHNSQKGFSVWALPASLAVTEGILVSFFSSA